MDILTRLHNLPPSRFHYKLLVLVGIGWLFDAMDTGLVSFVLPALGKDWALAPAQLGWIVSIAFGECNQRGRRCGAARDYSCF